MLINNHTSVWGSWYNRNTGHWGFACCHSIMHASYCTGTTGIEASKASSAQNLLIAAAASSSNGDIASTAKPSSDAPSERKRIEQKFGKSRLGEGDLQLNDERLAKAMQEERKRKAKDDEEEEGWRSKKRAANGSTLGGSHEVTEEELGLSFISLPIQ